jgi:hypothetical protein
MPENCPFCKQPAEFRATGSDDVEMDCRNCLIEVTFVETSGAYECRNPGNTLGTFGIGCGKGLAARW